MRFVTLSFYYLFRRKCIIAKLEQPAKPWYYRGQVAGFKTIYKDKLTFLTGTSYLRTWKRCAENIYQFIVRGAGHMVPQKKGFEVLHAIERFMQEKQI
jgi:hypothetical protein